MEQAVVYLQQDKYQIDTGKNQSSNSILDEFCEDYITLSGVITTSGVQLEEDLENRMRILANRLIDLILEDKEKGALRFAS